MKTLTCILALALVSVSISADEKRSAWKPLFDGKSLAGWQTLSGKPITGWVAKDGTLSYSPSKKGNCNLYTEKEYANFELELEFKIVTKGNSGVKYRMAYYDKSYLGPEFQILGDAAKKKGKSMSATGALYVLSPVDLEKRKLHPDGEWNKARIVAKGKTFEHYLNGQLTVSVDLNSEEFKKAVLASKFKKWPHYAQNKSGRIMLQDHGSDVSYRNIRIKELP